MEAPDELITLERAGALSGRQPGTLRVQANKGKLQATRLGYTWFTTRQWLHAYVEQSAQETRGKHVPLPAHYTPPDSR